MGDLTKKVMFFFQRGMFQTMEGGKWLECCSLSTTIIGSFSNLKGRLHALGRPARSAPNKLVQTVRKLPPRIETEIGVEVSHSEYTHHCTPEAENFHGPTYCQSKASGVS